MDEIIRFLNTYKKGMVFFKDKGFIGNAIIESQNIRWNGKSQWSHIGFFYNEKFYESTVKFKITKERKKFLFFHINIPKLQYVYGIYITDIAKRFKNWRKSYSKLGIQYNFNFSERIWKKAIEKAEQMKKNHIKYGGLELFGTLSQLIKWKMTKDPEKREKILQEKNPFNTSSVYCIAFVADCFSSVKYIDVESSISTVDDGWFTKLPHSEVII